MSNSLVERGMMTNRELIEKAKQLVSPIRLSDHAISGEVASVLITSKGKMYAGVSVHAACGLGFCAEHNAIGSMLTNRESRIERIVAVGEDGRILPPCGRCREMMYQINPANAEAAVMVAENRLVRLRDLLPEYWCSPVEASS